MAETAPEADANVNVNTNAPARSSSVGFHMGRQSSSNARINEILEVGEFSSPHASCMRQTLEWMVYETKHGKRSTNLIDSLAHSSCARLYGCLSNLPTYLCSSYRSQPCPCLDYLHRTINWWRSSHQLPADLPSLDIASDTSAQYRVLSSHPSPSSYSSFLIILLLFQSRPLILESVLIYSVASNRTLVNAQSQWLLLLPPTSPLGLPVVPSSPPTRLLDRTL
jgi:hypothetical protein